jgi:enoyl-CoA hydratase/carnithine racemase
LNASIETDLKTGLEQVEKGGYAVICETEDRIEGLKSFIENRAPVYKGK